MVQTATKKVSVSTIISSNTGADPEIEISGSLKTKGDNTMRKRQKMNKRKSKRLFKKTAKKTHKKNISRFMSRGGIRA